MGMGMGVGLTLMGMGKNGKAESHCRTLLNTSRPTSSSHNAVSKQLDDLLADSSLNDMLLLPTIGQTGQTNKTMMTKS